MMLRRSPDRIPAGPSSVASPTRSRRGVPALFHLDLRRAFSFYMASLINGCALNARECTGNIRAALAAKLSTYREPARRATAAGFCVWEVAIHAASLASTRGACDLPSRHLRPSFSGVGSRPDLTQLQTVVLPMPPHSARTTPMPRKRNPASRRKWKVRQRWYSSRAVAAGISGSRHPFVPRHT